MPKHPNLHIFFGPDEFRRQEAVRADLQRLMPSGASDFDVERLSGRGLDAERLATVVGTPPLLANRRVVVIDDAGDLVKDVVTTLVREIQASLATDPHALAIILSYPGDKKPPKELSALASVEQQFRIPTRGDVLTFARTYAQTKHGLTLAHGVADLLVTSVGIQDSGKIAAEIDKLATIATDGRITEDHILFATAETAMVSPFTFCDHVAERRYAEARRLLSALMTQPDVNGIFLVIVLANHLAHVGHARARLDAGVEAHRVAREIVDTPQKEWIGKKYVTQARHWTLSSIDRALSLLGETDLQIKKHGADQQQALELFLARSLLDVD